MAQRLGELLCAQSRLTPQALGRGLEEQRRNGGLLGEQLVALKLLEPTALSAALARQAELQRIEYETTIPSLAAFQEVAQRWLHLHPHRSHRVVRQRPMARQLAVDLGPN